MSATPKDKGNIMRYVEICNAALAQNAGRFPFSCILQAVGVSGKIPRIRIAIKGRDNNAPMEISLEQGKIILSETKDAEKLPLWRICPEYLADVLANPQSYIDNPALLNWEWLYTGRS